MALASGLLVKVSFPLATTFFSTLFQDSTKTTGVEFFKNFFFNGFFHIFQSWISIQYRCGNIVSLFYKFPPAWASQHKFRQRFFAIVVTLIFGIENLFPHIFLSNEYFFSRGDYCVKCQTPAKQIQMLMWSLFEYTIVQVITFFRLTTATDIQAKAFASHKEFQWPLAVNPIFRKR